MTIFAIKVATNNVKDVLDIVEAERNRGYEIWAEDENGRKIDEGTAKKNGAQSIGRSLYEKVVGLLFLATAVAVGIGILYALSLLAGD
jgi:ABC-type nitrate/sulfonate/bicarbonate transport system permease component